MVRFLACWGMFFNDQAPGFSTSRPYNQDEHGRVLTRAAILIRIDSLSQGASGVLLPTGQGLIRLLKQNEGDLPPQSIDWPDGQSSSPRYGSADGRRT